MSRITVLGGQTLRGTVAVAGAKNSALKLMAAALLAEGRTTLRSVPDILDVVWMGDLLESLGCEVVRADEVVQVDVPPGLRTVSTLR